MNPFEVWLLLIGLSAGAGLAWLVMADLRRDEDDVSDEERWGEAGWIAGTLSSSGIEADEAAVDEVLRLHRAYLGGTAADTVARPLAPPEVEGSIPSYLIADDDEAGGTR